MLSDRIIERCAKSIIDARDVRHRASPVADLFDLLPEEVRVAAHDDAAAVLRAVGFEELLKCALAAELELQSLGRGHVHAQAVLERLRVAIRVAQEGPPPQEG